MHFQTIYIFFLALLVVRILIWVFKSLTSPLRSIPGPFWTRFTRLWYAHRIWAGHFEEENIEIHRKYGALVRISPDHYSINDPTAIRTIYGIGTEFPKSQWYDGWKHPDVNKWTLFAMRDGRFHADTRKRFTSMYSMTSLVNYEAYVDECVALLTQRLEELSLQSKSADMANWLRCYAFDVIGNITYSNRFGFLDQGKDIDHIMTNLDRLQVYSSLIGVFAEWHPRLFGILSRFTWSGAAGRVSLMNFVQSMMDQRREKRQSLSNDEDPSRPQDFLDKMLRANEKDPGKVTSFHVFMVGLSNIVAGSDTTGASLSAILYHLIRHPESMRKLREEISLFRKDGRYGNPISFKDSQSMPYLQAVMKEAMRIHSATGLPLWRSVPAGGAQLGGRCFPEGAVVGVNTWCVHFDRDIFGEDAGAFKPERWIDAEQNKERLKAMESCYMPFGLGSRTCIGKNISILEMSKLIPQLVMKFDFEFAKPNMPWRTENHWFVMPKDFDVIVKLRNES